MENVREQWKRAQMIMLHKPRKSPKDATSYKLISLVPCLSKLLKKLLLKRLKPIIEEKYFISEYQFGFRNRHSTIEQVNRVINVISKVQYANFLTINNQLTSTDNLQKSIGNIFFWTKR